MEHIGTQVIETERLYLRPLTVNDAKEMYHNWASNDLVTKYLPWPTYTELQPVVDYLKTKQEQYETNKLYDWGIVLKDTNTLIGSITFVGVSENDKKAEIGYVIGSDWWGQGYVTEASKAVCQFGFNQLKLNRIQAVYDIDNGASGRVMEKIGMQYEGTLRESRIIKGKYVTLKVFSILKNEFLVQQQ